MKLTNYFTATALFIFFSTPVLAENPRMKDSELIASLAKASSPENVKAVTLQHKALNCNQNAKNFQYQGSQKEDYISRCVNKNEAMLAFASINKQNQLASTDVNEMLRQSPSAAGKK